MKKSKLLLLIISFVTIFSLSGCSNVYEREKNGCKETIIEKKFLFWKKEYIVKKVCPDSEDPDLPDIQVPNPNPDDENEEPSKEKDEDYTGEIPIPDNAGNPNAGLNGQLEIDSWKFESNMD